MADQSLAHDNGDAWFLRTYAQAVRDGKERTIDIPSVIASTFDGIARRIEVERARAAWPDDAPITFDGEVRGPRKP